MHKSASEHKDESKQDLDSEKGENDLEQIIQEQRKTPKLWNKKPLQNSSTIKSQNSKFRVFHPSNKSLFQHRHTHEITWNKIIPLNYRIK